jgi:phosphohistidine swiveling domain-containing protein
MAAVEFEEGGLTKDAAAIGRGLNVEPSLAQPSDA